MGAAALDGGATTSAPMKSLPPKSKKQPLGPPEGQVLQRSAQNRAMWGEAMSVAGEQEGSVLCVGATGRALLPTQVFVRTS